ncbi:MAG TPA: amino acid adenylation domain-containing protein [Burkholderiaceae bacterium]|nr:amino acid adenylation domain-containing protein [Burkholderiaceae bacterium]
MPLQSDVSLAEAADPVHGSRPLHPVLDLFDDDETVYVEPATPTQRRLAALWAQVLQQDDPVAPRVGAADDFFELGGHSLLAVQLFARVLQEFGVDLPISTLFKAPVLAAFAQAVDSALQSRGGPSQRIVPVGRDGPLPLSYQQERLWFVHEHMPEQRISYNLAFSCALHGPGFDPASFRRAVNALIERHETLRTTFAASSSAGMPVQRVLPRLEIDVPVVDVRGDELALRCTEIAAHDFDLVNGPLLKVAVLRVQAGHHVLMFNLHHTICDGWSVGVLFRDLQAFYAQAATGEMARLPPLPVQYADFAAWQRRQDLAGDLAYWTGLLKGYDDALALPLDHPRPLERAWPAAAVRHVYPADLAERVSAMCRQRSTTLFMTLVAAMSVVLHRYTGRKDLCIGSTIGGREAIELEQVVGFFVNILPLRLDLTGDPTAHELLERTRARVLAGMEHSRLPFEHMLSALQVQRDGSRIPLVPLLLRHQNFPAAATPRFGDGLRIGEVDFGSRTATSEMDFQFFGTGRDLEVTVEYAQPLFDAATIRRVLSMHEEVLRVFVDDPQRRLSAFPRLAAGDAELYERLRGPVHALAEPCSLAACWEQAASQHAQRPCCMDEHGQVLSFAELDRAANGLARRLQGWGVGVGTPVAVVAERTPALLVALVAILKRGACYAPVDADHPAAYVEQVLQEVQPRVVLARPGLDLPGVVHARLDLARLLRDAEPQGPAAAAVPLQAPGYVMMTSGSTGRPKAVVVPYEQIENWLRAAWRRWPVQPDDVVLQKTAIAFSVSVKELLIGLLAGAPQLMVSAGAVRDAAALAALIERHRVTRMNLVPSHLASLIDGGQAARLQSLRVVVTAGEALTVALAERVRQALPGAALWNNYGCTELNDVTYQAVTAEACTGGFVPIGVPIENRALRVLDEEMEPVPVGAVGELHVQGLGLAHGYAGQPGLTATRFVADPWGPPGARMYRTGDLVRLRGDGRLEYLGRRDLEIKVRGHRIDVRQVEAALAAHPDVAQCVVQGWPVGAPDAALTAWAVPREGASLSAAQLRQHVAERLPAFMVPSLYALPEALPCLPNGKLDRLHLPAPGLPPAAVAIAPRLSTELERRVAALWRRALALPEDRDIGPGDSFFELGGHSLLAASLLAGLREDLHMDVPMSLLFDVPQLGAFVQAIASQHRGEAAAAERRLVTLAGRPGMPVVVCVHPIGGQVQVYADLARRLGEQVHVLGLQAPSVPVEGSLDERLQACADLLAESLPAAPRAVRLLGWSSGGLLAAALAPLLRRRGVAVDHVALIDTSPIPLLARTAGRLPAVAALNTLASLRGCGFTVADVETAHALLEREHRSAPHEAGTEAHGALRRIAAHFGVPVAPDAWDYLASRQQVTQVFLGYLAGYQPDPATPELHLYAAEDRDALPELPEAMAWRAGFAPQRTHVLPGNHYTAMQGAAVAALAGLLLSAWASLEE